ncbi:MAG: prolyl-tRNA synthetase associated domain-containing protein, partial [Brucella anthropi]
MPLSPSELHDYLQKLGIEVKTVEHPPLFTVADSQS